MKKILVLFFTCMLIASPASSQGLFGTLVKAIANEVKQKTSKKEKKQSDAPEPAQSKSTETNKPSKDDVVLTVSADGSTKDEATKNALRSAIEQAYGTFVSANTTILNDELVKDEIVTVSNGSIKDYKEIAAMPTDKGGYLVTLTATVSLPQLIEYVKSHGSECEFAGNTFGMEMKMFELQKKNELKALYNLTDQVIAMLPNVMKYEMTIGEPAIATETLRKLELEAHAQIKTSEGKIFWAYYWALKTKEYNGNSYYESELLNKKANEHLKQFDKKNIEQTGENYYCMPMTIKWISAEEGRLSVLELIRNTISAISTTNLEYEKYRKQGLKVSYLNLPFTIENHYYEDEIVSSKNSYFRNSNKDIAIWLYDFLLRIEKKFNEFVIKDNTGTESTFYPQEICDENYSHILTEYGYGIFGSGIFHDIFKYDTPSVAKSVQDHKRYYETSVISSHSIPEYSFITVHPQERLSYGRPEPLQWNLLIFIHKDDISKYSKFWVESKPEIK